MNVSTGNYQSSVHTVFSQYKSYHLAILPFNVSSPFLARKTRPTRPRWSFLSLRLELGVVDQGTRALEINSSLIDNRCALVSPIEVWLLYPKKHLGIRCKDKGLWVVMEALPLLVPPPPLEVLYMYQLIY